MRTRGSRGWDLGCAWERTTRSGCGLVRVGGRRNMGLRTKLGSRTRRDGCHWGSPLMAAGPGRVRSNEWERAAAAKEGGIGARSAGRACPRASRSVRGCWSPVQTVGASGLVREGEGEDVDA